PDLLPIGAELVIPEKETAAANEPTATGSPTPHAQLLSPQAVAPGQSFSATRPGFAGRAP
ncbi:MAG: hypothetical protein AAF596_10430, partial [Planctomycetota bacterium]